MPMTVFERVNINCILRDLLYMDSERKAEAFVGYGSMQEIKTLIGANLARSRFDAIVSVNHYLHHRRKQVDDGAKDDFVMTHVLRECLVPWLRLDEESRRLAIQELKVEGLRFLGAADIVETYR